MKPEDMFAETPKANFISNEQLALWPQARGELWGFVRHLERMGLTITATQLRMAVLLADETFEKRNG